VGQKNGGEYVLIVQRFYLLSLANKIVTYSEVLCAIIYASGAKAHLLCNYIKILSTVNILQLI
jgi:hypothetical protein